MQVSKSVGAVFNRYDPSAKDLFVFLADQRPVPKPWTFDGQEEPFRVKENPYPTILGLPFNHLYKTHTIDLHFMFNTEPLLELSHSCTQLKSGRCNDCYHCHERQWAFDQLNKIDPGTN
jgi:7-cyano-7-deazaguanine synthase in queuosine biosynthesis